MMFVVTIRDSNTKALCSSSDIHTVMDSLRRIDPTRHYEVRELRPTDSVCVSVGGFEFIGPGIEHEINQTIVAFRDAGIQGPISITVI